ncbi:MAG: S41 family peptidase [Verrucomicrobiales bacterium]|jgi:hypothetical protein|nr:S41 family peptidase [Verrucomicrobiales bacterium]
MRTIFNILLLTVVSFIAGAAVTWFCLVEYPKISGAAKTVADHETWLPPRIPGTVLEPDPYADTPAADAPEKILSPSADEAGEIIDLLRTQFIDAAALISQQLSPETLNGLFAKNGDKAKLSVSAVMTPDPQVKTILQTLPPNLAYWRPADFSQKELDNFLRQWDTLTAGDLHGLIIDLRNFRDGNDLQGAAMLAGLLVPSQDVLFTVEGLNFPQQVFRAQHQPLGLKQDFPLAVLVNQATRGAAEALAFTLKQKGTALIIGKKTAGEGGLFTETKLNSGRYLRLATARITGADGTDLLGTPLTPDISVNVSAQSDDEAWQGAYHYGIASVTAVSLPDRAALKEREDLDLPLDNPPPSVQAPHDLILSAAADVLAGITLNRGGR